MEKTAKQKLRSYKKYISNRILLTAVFIFLQVGFLVFGMLQLLPHYQVLTVIMRVLGLFIVVFLVRREQNASYKIGWIILVLLLPLFGAPLYLCFGNQRNSGRIRNRVAAEETAWRKRLRQNTAVMRECYADNPRIACTSNYLYRYSGFPLYHNSPVTYFPSGEAMFAAMKQALKSARHFIFLEYFIIGEGRMWNEILQILRNRAAAGVEVRVIYDDFGSIITLPANYWKKLSRYGIACQVFNPVVPLLAPVMNNRDHRKIMIIDGHTAFSGGINLADEYINEYPRFGHWKDTGFRMQGSAVWSYTAMFLSIWNAFRKDSAKDAEVDRFRPENSPMPPLQDDGFVQPFSDSPFDNEPVSRNLYMEILNQAQRYAYIFTPYLIPDDELKNAIGQAAKRGVDVRIITPGIPDKKIIFRVTRSYYLPLLRQGVKIYEYTPGFLHAKSCVCDDKYAVLGTINMDYRSLYLHYECGTLLYRSRAILDVRRDIEQTIRQSRQIRPENCKTSFLGLIYDALLRLFAPLF